MLCPQVSPLMHSPPFCKVWIAEDLTLLPNLLSKEEQVRADKFRFDSDRECFTQTHSALRLALSQIQPERALETWKFAKTDKDKPFLADVTNLHFNISHSKSCYAVGVSDRPLGIDIERIGRRNDYEKLLDLTTHPSERSWLESTGIEERDFLTVWTRKEALLKATGEGVARDLTAIDTLPTNRGQSCTIDHGGNWLVGTRYYETCILSWAVTSLDTEQEVDIHMATELSDQ